MDLSNIRVTTKVAVNALLGDTPALQDYGSAIMHNLGTKEVKAVVCINPIKLSRSIYTCVLRVRFCGHVRFNWFIALRWKALTF